MNIPDHLNPRFNNLYKSTYRASVCAGCGDDTYSTNETNVIWVTAHGVIPQNKWTAIGGKNGKQFCKDCVNTTCADCY